MLVELAKMSKEERKEHEWFGLFLDVRKYGWEGVIAKQNEKWEIIINPKKYFSTLKKKIR